MSPDYYSEREQGRQAHISTTVLDALARALRLSDVERANLHALAAPSQPTVAGRPNSRSAPTPGCSD